ncbi:hypothetical protein GIB67_028006 [Kingdonia uniflora]|uniref:Eukaryotic translation initiation factor 4G n=1 Tax=Kingdonia uniflora TaxID=39325 RepID=A0A7J7L791_9MAGN|nr:hypothetical protein GIB67_028006 [Kingdonia uniflora]
MSRNQYRGEKSEANSSKFGRPRSFGDHRRGPPSGANGAYQNSYYSNNRSFNKSSNGHGVQQYRVSTSHANSTWNVVTPACPEQKNDDRGHPPSNASSDARDSGNDITPDSSATTESTEVVQKALSAQPCTQSLDSVTPTTPPKRHYPLMQNLICNDIASGDGPKPFSFRFGSFSPTIVNAVQVPSQTSSVPPILDEPKLDQVPSQTNSAPSILDKPELDQAHHNSSQVGSTLPEKKDLYTLKKSCDMSHLPSETKMDSNCQIPVAPAITVPQKSSIQPVTCLPMQVPYLHNQIPVPFFGPDPLVQWKYAPSMAHQLAPPFVSGINYYPLLQPNSYNSSTYFQTQTSHSLTNTQVTTSSLELGYNYLVAQGPPTAQFVAPLDHMPVPMAGTSSLKISQSSNSGHFHSNLDVAGSASLVGVEMVLNSVVGTLGETIGSYKDKPKQLIGNEPQHSQPKYHQAESYISSLPSLGLEHTSSLGVASSDSLESIKQNPLSSSTPIGTVERQPLAVINVIPDASELVSKNYCENGKGFSCETSSIFGLELKTSLSDDLNTAHLSKLGDFGPKEAQLKNERGHTGKPGILQQPGSNIEVPAEKLENDGPDFDVAGSGMSSQESVPVSAEVGLELDQEGTQNKGGETASAFISGSNDELNLELKKIKSATGRKKKLKDILKAADAAGSASDLYMAYKGPEEKQESCSSPVSPSSICVMEAPLDNVNADGLNKAEPDDWEDVVDDSRAKLKTWNNGKLGHDNGENGNEVMGKKYSRDFLLTFTGKYSDLPINFQIEFEMAKSLMGAQVSASRVAGGLFSDNGKIIDSLRVKPVDKAIMGPQIHLHTGKWNKLPAHTASGHGPRFLDVGQGRNHVFLKNSREQFVGGILSAPLHRVQSQGGVPRSSHDIDKRQSVSLQKGLISSYQTPLQVMHKAEKKYEVGQVSDKEMAKQRQLKGILNKLTPQNFDKLFQQVKEVNIDNVVTLTGVILQIFDKALTEPTFCEMYANFCYHLANELPEFSEDNEKINFKRLLLNKCQEEFERGEREEAEANRVERDGETKQSDAEREDKKIKARRQTLGNIRLIGELYKKKMLTERIMHGCITQLLGQSQNLDEENVEALCKLMCTIGEIIDHAKAKEHMDGYFNVMTKLSTTMKLSSRVRFMLRDAIDLRKNRWRQRRTVEGPKKIDQVHRDAAQEREQASKMARGPGISSSARWGQSMDFGPRRPSMMHPSNSQLGGICGLAPPVCGYAVEDYRIGNIHRTMSVPLAQRFIHEDYITFGPKGGLARGMCIRDRPLMASIPFDDISSRRGDSRSNVVGSDGQVLILQRPHEQANSKVEPILSYGPRRFISQPAFEEANSHEQNTSVISHAIHVQESSAVAQNVTLEETLWSTKHRDVVIGAIREFYSAKDEKEVALCMKEFNCLSFYPSMVSIWVTDSFGRKDTDRDLLAKLLINLNKSRDPLLSQSQLIHGFESVLSTLEDEVYDAPKAAEFLGSILAKLIMENTLSLKVVGWIILAGGEEPGRLLQIGLASKVFGSILEVIKSEKGVSTLNAVLGSSGLQLVDFRPPDQIK